MTRTPNDLDPLDFIIQGVVHILPSLMALGGITIITYYLYGALT